MPKLPIASLSRNQRTDGPVGRGSRYCDSIATVRLEPVARHRVTRCADPGAEALGIGGDGERRLGHVDSIAIRPLLKFPGIDYVGEISDGDKQAFLGGAMALLFPIDWPEPFGLVQIEAMACGTPVIAWRRGSVPEVVDHGVTGAIVETVEEAVAAVETVRSLDRKAVRERFESRFSVERAARDYVRVYESLAEPILLCGGGVRAGAEAKPRALTAHPIVARPAAVRSRGSRPSRSLDDP